ncbi:MAG: YqgE/AlgH family protein [Pseudomonadota bacterium]
MDLTGQLLIAMPGMADPRFDRSVVFLCAHSTEGAMGLVVNNVVADLSFAELLSQLDITPADDVQSLPVHMGGPVEHGRGFVLHSSEYSDKDATLQVDETFAMTATLDILEDIARGLGPDRSLMALGYAGWGPGQLEGEIARNAWLTCPARSELVFSTDPDAKWTGALATLGIDPLTLSAAAGRA